ncbi:MAG: YtxH domain-containing protein [Chitinophagales bacterium]
MEKSSKILIAGAAGLAAGALLGVLLAPEKGVESRQKLAKGLRKLNKVIHGDISKEKLAFVKDKLEKHKERLERHIQKIEARLNRQETNGQTV